MRKLDNRGSSREADPLFVAVAIIATLLFIFRACSAQGRARNYGGEMTITLDPGVKLEEITWKDDDNLWYLTRPMREDEHAETHVFEADTVFGVFEGKITIIEQEATK